MIYNDINNNNIRANCPLTYTQTSMDFDNIVLHSGTYGIDGTYRIHLKEALKSTPGTYVVDIEGVAKDSRVGYINKFTLIIIDACDDLYTSGKGTYGTITNTVVYSNYDAPNYSNIPTA